MGIRHLDSFLKEKKLVHKSSITTLDDCRLAIDGHVWLKQIILKFPQDFTTTVMGGIPLSLSVNIHKELDYIEKFNIHPIFVFSGLNLNKNETPFIDHFNSSENKKKGWEAYEKGQPDLASSFWKTSVNVQHADILGLVFSIFHDRNIEFIRAPYMCSAQLAYLANKNVVHAIYSDNELILYDVDHIITEMNFEDGLFSWISRDEIIKYMKVTNEQFIDICLLSGTRNLSTLPILSPKGSTIFSAAWELVNQHRSAQNILTTFADNPKIQKLRYFGNFSRIKYSIKYHMVMNDQGLTSPLSSQAPPPDALDFLGNRLPNEFYYYLGQGLIGPDVMNYLVHGNWNEYAPLCNGDFTEYHQLLDDLSPLRSQILYLATQHLSNYYKGLEVVTIYWYDPKTHHSLNSFSDVQMPKLMTAKWRCEQATLDEEKSRQKTSDLVDLSFVVKASESQNFLKLQSDSPTTLESSEQIVTTALMRFLEFRGLINLPQVSSTFGNTLINALNKNATKESKNFTEELIVGLELIRLNVLHNNPYSNEYPEPLLSSIPDEEKQHARLITRVLSLLPVTFSSAPWVGPVDHNLLCFHSCVKLLYTNLRNAVEMTVLSIFLSKECKLERSDYTKISLMLPFLQESNTAMGVLVKTYLSKVNSNLSESSKNSLYAEELPKLFPSCYNIKNELEKGFEFWDQLTAAVTTLESPEYSSISNAFKEADSWLSKRRF